MTYIYSLYDGVCRQGLHTLPRPETINRTLFDGVNAPHLEHRFRQTCSSSPSPSQSSSPPSTSLSPGRNAIFLFVPYLAPKLQGTRRDAIRACLPLFPLCRVLILPDPPRCRYDPTCVCTNLAFIDDASSCVLQSCDYSDAQTAIDCWSTVCDSYGPPPGNHPSSIIDPPFIDNW